MLSYGEFSVTKKLFSYENHGIPTMPIFYDAELSLKFAKFMEVKLREFGDRRHLLTQICDSPRKACDMLQVISAISPELHTIAIDPTIVDGEVADSQQLDFGDAIDQLQEGLSSESVSSAEGPEEGPDDGYSSDDSKT